MLMLRRCLPWLLFGAVSPAFAQESAGPSSAPAALSAERAFRIGIDYRLWTSGLSPFPVEPNGGDLGQFAFVEHRLRVDPVWTLAPRLRLIASADLLTGLIGGQTSDVIFAADAPRSELDGLTTATARQLLLEYRFLGSPERPGGVLRAGLQTSQFGNGLLSNDGNGDEQDWGLKRFGDQTFRLLLGGRPIAIATKGKKGLPFQVVLAGDIVRDDNLANLNNGDKAFQGVVALQYLTEPFEAGLYGALRHQTAAIDDGDVDAEGLDVVVADLFLKGHHDGKNLSIKYTAEGVVVQGTTTLNRSEDFPDGTDILQGAAMARVGFTKKTNTIELEGGYTSGDSNPQDGTITNFSMSRDYNVSLILFEEVLAAQTARDSSRAQDPATVGIPPDGVELLPTNGATTNAAYGKVTWRYEPNKDLKLVGTLLYAHATADLVAPFASFENGGVFTNHLGGSPFDEDGNSRRSLGIETDLGISYSLRAGRVPIKLRAQAGVFFPGNAFTDAQDLKMSPVVSMQSGIVIPANILP
jgi:hypothetical protein